LKQAAKILMTWFPVIIVAGQVGCNILFMLNPDYYIKNAYTLCGLFGMNWITVLFMVSFTFYFKFCAISRLCALVELYFGVMTLISDDWTYNLMLKTMVGVLAVLITGIIFTTEKKESEWTREQS
jgi:hypothetical protein